MLWKILVNSASQTASLQIFFSQETFLNSERLETIHSEFGVNTISYNSLKGCKNLTEAYFRIVKSVRDVTFEGCLSLETLKLGSPLKTTWALSSQKAVLHLNYFGFWYFHFRNMKKSNAFNRPKPI